MTDLTDAELDALEVAYNWSYEVNGELSDLTMLRLIAEVRRWRATHTRGATRCYVSGYTSSTGGPTTVTVSVGSPEGAHGPEGAKDE